MNSHMQANPNNRSFLPLIHNQNYPQSQSQQQHQNHPPQIPQDYPRFAPYLISNSRNPQAYPFQAQPHIPPAPPTQPLLPYGQIIKEPYSQQQQQPPPNIGFANINNNNNNIQARNSHGESYQPNQQAFSPTPMQAVNLQPTIEQNHVYPFNQNAGIQQNNNQKYYNIIQPPSAQIIQQQGNIHPEFSQLQQQQHHPQQPFQQNNNIFRPQHVVHPPFAAAAQNNNLLSLPHVNRQIYHSNEPKTNPRIQDRVFSDKKDLGFALIQQMEEKKRREAAEKENKRLEERNLLQYNQRNYPFMKYPNQQSNNQQIRQSPILHPSHQINSAAKNIFNQPHALGQATGSSQKYPQSEQPASRGGGVGEKERERGLRGRSVKSFHEGPPSHMKAVVIQSNIEEEAKSVSKENEGNGGGIRRRAAKTIWEDSASFAEKDRKRQQYSEHQQFLKDQIEESNRRKLQAKELEKQEELKYELLFQKQKRIDAGEKDSESNDDSSHIDGGGEFSSRSQQKQLSRIDSASSTQSRREQTMLAQVQNISFALLLFSDGLINIFICYQNLKGVNNGKSLRNRGQTQQNHWMMQHPPHMNNGFAMAQGQAAAAAGMDYYGHQMYMNPYAGMNGMMYDPAMAAAAAAGAAIDPKMLMQLGENQNKIQLMMNELKLDCDRANAENHKQFQDLQRMIAVAGEVNSLSGFRGRNDSNYEQE